MAAAPLIEGSRLVRIDPPLGKCQWGCNTDQEVWLGIPIHVCSCRSLSLNTVTEISGDNALALCNYSEKYTALNLVSGRVSSRNSWMDTSGPKQEGRSLSRQPQNGPYSRRSTVGVSVWGWGDSSSHQTAKGSRCLPHLAFLV